PGPRTDVIAPKEIDVAELAVRGRGDRPFAAGLCRGDAPVERGRALFVLAFGRVDQSRTERELRHRLERSIACRLAGGDGPPESIDACLDRSGAHGRLAGFQERPRCRPSTARAAVRPRWGTIHP